ncbi:hypothetical protein J437_LFUL012016 [Ladona fulva]|uniref:phospholipase A2 n=1 Tax=Ladona fulva TaxID=123851 RepID=A0A8K0P481_LADFU|nr:hypothetical protein J437_LFUL012016 [Ladona fulva]
MSIIFCPSLSVLSVSVVCSGLVGGIRKAERWIAVHSWKLFSIFMLSFSNPEEKMEILRNLSRLRPLSVTFEQMMELISKCQELSEQERNMNAATRGPRKLTENNKESQEQLRARSLDAGGALTLFQGILPGTKWCGTGDLATTYYDLGPDMELDVCCRSHDLCPVKVRAFTSRFNLTNYSIYSKSHCECDEMFYNCLKRTSHPNALMIGNFYFNLLRVPCIDKQVYEKQAAPVSNDMQFKRNKLTF